MGSNVSGVSSGTTVYDGSFESIELIQKPEPEPEPELEAPDPSTLWGHPADGMDSPPTGGGGGGGGLPVTPQPPPTPIETQPPPPDEVAKKPPVDPKIHQAPDKPGKLSDPRLSAETRPKLDYKDGQVKLSVETQYKDKATLANKDKIESQYGRGTTPEDKRNGNTSLAFHEQQHRAELERWMKDNPPPQPYLNDGMSQSEIDAELKRYFENDVPAYLDRAQDATEAKVDEVGTKKSEHPEFQ
jgi:hypothetical protein